MSQNVTSLLQQLIRIPSLNPEHAPDSPHAGEENLAIFLAGWLESIGAEVTLEEVKTGRPNLIARFAPLDGRPRILLNAPTVPITYPFGLLGDDENSDTVYACDECLPWSVDITRDDETGAISITEWHAIDCGFVTRWLAPDGENHDGR